MKLSTFFNFIISFLFAQCVIFSAAVQKTLAQNVVRSIPSLHHPKHGAKLQLKMCVALLLLLLLLLLTGRDPSCVIYPTETHTQWHSPDDIHLPNNLRNPCDGLV